jgi:hypothetical protein
MSPALRLGNARRQETNMTHERPEIGARLDHHACESGTWGGIRGWADDRARNDIPIVRGNAILRS